MQKIFKGPYILFAYLTGAVAVFAGAFHNYYLLVLGMLALMIWDLLYVFDEGSFHGRSASSTNESVTRARTYISWYIGMYGVIMGLALTRTEGSNMLETLLANAQIPNWLVGLPLILSIVSMLFIPIQVGGSGKQEIDQPNVALKSLFFFVIYLQKVILILIGHMGLRVLFSWT